MPKVLTTPLLKELNDAAIASERNRAIHPQFIEDRIDPDGIHVVALALLHNDVEIRVQLLLKLTGEIDPVQGTLDLTFEQFHALPEVSGRVGA